MFLSSWRISCRASVRVWIFSVASSILGSSIEEFVKETPALFGGEHAVTGVFVDLSLFFFEELGAEGLGKVLDADRGAKVEILERVDGGMVYFLWEEASAEVGSV